MSDVVPILWEYLLGGQLWNYFVYMLNFYFPYGMFFWMLGFVLFLIIQLKSESLIYATIPLAVYFVIISSIDGLVINAYSRMAMQYVGLVLVLVSGYYLYRIVRGNE